MHIRSDSGLAAWLLFLRSTSLLAVAAAQDGMTVKRSSDQTAEAGVQRRISVSRSRFLQRRLHVTIAALADSKGTAP